MGLQLELLRSLSLVFGLCPAPDHRVTLYSLSLKPESGLEGGISSGGVAPPGADAARAKSDPKQDVTTNTANIRHLICESFILGYPPWFQKNSKLGHLLIF